jgi:proteasome lid subunit RPN8/RPN11
VRLPVAIREQLIRQAVEASPRECCGLLLGSSDEIVEARPAPNIAADPVRRFEIDPSAHFAAIRQARTAGLEVVGAYHSHPNGTAVPSETDRAEAFEDPDFLHVIVAPRQHEIAAYLLITGNFVAVPLVTTR